MEPTSGNVRLWSLAFASTVAALAFSSCGQQNSNVQAHPSAGKVSLAQPCDELEKGDPHAAPVAIFLQVANVQSTLANPLREYLRSNPVEANQVASMLIRHGKPAVSPWGTCTQGCANEESGTIAATLLGPSNLQIELVVRTPSRNPERAVVSVTDQTPSVVPFAGSSNGTIVATPYFMAEPVQQGLQALYNCKAKARTI